MKHRLTHYTEPRHIQAQGKENKRQAQIICIKSSKKARNSEFSAWGMASVQVQWWTSAPSCLEVGLVNVFQVGQAVSLITREM